MTYYRTAGEPRMVMSATVFDVPYKYTLLVADLAETRRLHRSHSSGGRRCDRQHVVSSSNTRE